MEVLQSNSKGSSRNVILELKKQGLIEPYCRSICAFYKLKTVDKSKMRKPMTLHRMEGNGVRRIHVDPIALLDSLPMEELCKVHDVRLTFSASGFYNALLSTGLYQFDTNSKDILFGDFIWLKYRSLKVFLHRSGTVTFQLDCSNCPIEASTMGFVSLAGFLGGMRKELSIACKGINPEMKEESIPIVDYWKVVMWHYGKDSAQEFSGEDFNITFKLWCGELARIYVHKQDHSRKVRFEKIETPKKPLQQVIADKLNLDCSRCVRCLRQSLLLLMIVQLILAVY